MPELTQRHLNAITTTAKNVAAMAKAVSNTAKAVAAIAGELRDIKTDVKATRTTVDMHTATLDGISKQLLDVMTDRAALVLRLERYDKFMKIVAEKLQLDLNAID